MKELLNNVEKLKRLIASAENEELISIQFFSEAFDLLYKMHEGLIAAESEQIQHLRRDLEARQTKLSGLKNGALANEPEDSSDVYLPATEPDEEPVVENPIVSEEVKQTVEAIVAPTTAMTSATATGKPKAAKDIRTLLSLNDRFRFQRELFNGDLSAFNDLIERLNEATSPGEAAQLFVSITHRADDDELTVEWNAVFERFFA